MGSMQVQDLNIGPPLRQPLIAAADTDPPGYGFAFSTEQSYSIGHA